MTIDELKPIINSTKKGTIHTLTYSKPLKTRKGVTDVITKSSTVQVRFGIDYDNMRVTKEGRADGTLPVVNQGLAPSLRWIDNNFIENTKNGNKMLRVSSAYGNKTVIKYYKNGVETTKEEIAPLCLASETAVHEVPTVMNIGIEKIISIN